MNLFFQGRMQAMPAGYRTDDDRFDVIRPLIECAEDKIAEYASMREFPILPCNLCGSQSGLQRDQMTQLLNNLESSIPNVREVMLASLKNVRTSHLLDTGLLGLGERKVSNDDLRTVALSDTLLQIEEPSFNPTS